jgi:hypothetical protein
VERRGSCAFRWSEAAFKSVASGFLAVLAAAASASACGLSVESYDTATAASGGGGEDGRGPWDEGVWGPSILFVCAVSGVGRVAAAGDVGRRLDENTMVHEPPVPRLAPEVPETPLGIKEDSPVQSKRQTGYQAPIVAT